LLISVIVVIVVIVVVVVVVVAAVACLVADELKPGVYAIDVVGELPDVVKEYLHGRDIPFRSSASNA